MDFHMMKFVDEVFRLAQWIVRVPQCSFRGSLGGCGPCTYRFCLSTLDSTGAALKLSIWLLN